ncbi:MAG: ABC transporter ATP-binding protein [Bifidobacteriaceae bacterium]|jgi:ABC-2 type transport system ATP-binding protein|nr:ABC transporter ATP-binding protein [Bifidobacteriaceae bacterium]
MAREDAASNISHGDSAATNNIELVISHLSKKFEAKTVLKDIDFTFESGKIYGLLGRNGAGKTTLFNCLNSDLRTDSGEFYLREAGIQRAIRPEDIGYVLSTPEVPEFLTAREFLRFFLDINQKDGAVPRSIDSYFDEVSIKPEDRDRLLKDFSQGMKNKMQMLANIIAQPRVTLLDEPLTSLDVVVAEEMKDLLRTLKPGRVTILSTHILDLAVDLCDDIVLLSGGRLERIDHANLSDDGFKERIIATLRGQE